MDHDNSTPIFPDTPFMIVVASRSKSVKCENNLQKQNNSPVSESHWAPHKYFMQCDLRK
jgi:hypothetical protein